jgi:hypothetical protein
MNCDICKDSGKCKNNEKSKDYDEFYSDYWDCVEYVELMEGKQKGSTMISWIKSTMDKNKDYESDFSLWSKRYN